MHTTIQFAYICLCILFMVAYALFMIPQSNASFLALNSITALLFPGPVILSKITLNTRHEFAGVFKYVPMLTGLIWFNQGFWFGSIISNSSVWTDWNVFFTSAAIFFILFSGLLYHLPKGCQCNNRRKFTVVMLYINII